jgi:ribosomal protein L22
VATTETREVRAQAKWVRTSARKARLVAEHIRGRPVPEARAVLAFTPRAAAREMEKVLRSAVANAEANHGLLGDDLFVSAAYVDEGPTLKRWRARARGRVARIRKRTCHITLVLEQAPEPAGGTTRRGRRSRAEASVPAEPKRRLAAPRRKPKAGETAAQAEAVVDEPQIPEPQIPEPQIQEPEPEPEEAARAEEPQIEESQAQGEPAEEPQAAEEPEPKPKPRRRPSVRRKKTEHEGSE